MISKGIYFAHIHQLLLTIAICVFTTTVAAQEKEITFTYSQHRVDDKSVLLTITAKTNGATKLYGLQQSPDDAVYSTLTFDSTFKKYLSGKIQSKGTLISEKDPVLNAPVTYTKDSVQWVQQIHLASTDSVLIKGTIAYMYQLGDEYLSDEEAFQFHVKAAISEKGEQGATEKEKEAAPRSEQSLIWIFIAAFGGGLLALLTPCVYSMIPITVSFFTKRSKTQKEGIRNAFFYSLSIIIIFVLLGFFITLIFGPAALNTLATNWIANLVFFIIFLIFGISFLGAFDVELPGNWSTKTDSKAGSGSFLGIFFMALTLVIVSFSCTGPIIGNLLVIASRGSYYGPLVGMFGFSLALALPFSLFALFPGKLNVLGKAGGWLNAIKVTLGFLELALALKFLSNADLAKNWRLLDREIFLVLWIVIFFLLGLYLLGKIKFKHDDALPKNDFGMPYLSVTRLFFAIAAFSFTVYMLPGLFGAPLKGLSAFLPPMGTQDFNADDLPPGANISILQNNATGAHTNADVLPPPMKYAEVMKKNEPDVVVNNGLITYFDYQEALEIARKVKKPLMLDFTGVNCINCRKMEGQVWSNPEVMIRLKENFVIASLFVDVHNGLDLNPSEQYFSKDLGKQVETLGDLNADIQVSRFGSNTQPFYFFLDEKEQLLAPKGYPYDASVQKFITHLDNVVAKYKATTHSSP